MKGIDPEMLVEMLCAQGMDEEQARKIADRTAIAEQQTRGLPAGADPMCNWAIIEVQRTEEAGGSDPVQVIPNGMAQLLERGRPIEVRWPYVEVLQHAEKIVYDEKLASDGQHREHIPRVVQTYPFQILEGPYERAPDYVPTNQ